jgi:hypothetical protein
MHSVLPLPPPSSTQYEIPLIASIWYGPATGSRLASRTHSASSVAGDATILSCRIGVSSAFVMSVPSTCASIATLSRSSA